MRSLIGAAGSLRRDLARLASTTAEQRRSETYAHAGYDYLRKIVPLLPEPGWFPVTRYQDTNRPAHLFFLPEYRSRPDPRVLVGIGLEEKDTGETAVAEARLQQLTGSHGLYRSTWLFRTHFDYDALTRLEFHSEPAAQSVSGHSYSVTLYETPLKSEVLGRWKVDSGGAPVFSHRLPRSRRFAAYSRGATDYELHVTGPARIGAIEVFGVKVDLTDYVLVHRGSGGFTAIRRDVLNKGAQPERWRRFIALVKSIR